MVFFLLKVYFGPWQTSLWIFFTKTVNGYVKFSEKLTINYVDKNLHHRSLQGSKYPFTIQEISQIPKHCCPFTPWCALKGHTNLGMQLFKIFVAFFSRHQVLKSYLWIYGKLIHNLSLQSSFVCTFYGISEII